MTPAGILSQAVHDALITLEGMLSQIIAFTPRLLAGLVIGVIMWLAARWARAWARRLARRSKMPQEVETLTVMAVHITALLLGATVTLAVLGVRVYALVTGLGVGGLIVGFALQNVIQNLLAGALLLIQRPFGIGDLITVNNVTGWVTEIQIRSTTIKTFDNLQVIVPNQTVYTSVLTNYQTYAVRRRSVSLGIGYREDLAHAMQVLLDAARGVAGVAADPAPSIAMDDFGDSAITGGLYYYIDTSKDDFSTTHNDVLAALQKASHAMDIDLPYPTMTIIESSPAS
jgi:small conductance mechanosensitive channel